MANTKDVLRIASLAAVLIAASCAAPFNDGNSPTTDPQLNHPISVEPAMKSLGLPFSLPQAGLMPDDAARFSAFVTDFLDHGNGAISISAPEGRDSEEAIDYFGERLASMGVPRSRILVGTHDGADHRVELSYMSYTAETAPCGDWSEDAAHTASNAPSPNFGCAVQHNIAAMVADPRDLIQPRAEEASDAERRSVVNDKYEKGQITGADKGRDQTAAVSDVDR